MEYDKTGRSGIRRFESLDVLIDLISIDGAYEDPEPDKDEQHKKFYDVFTEDQAATIGSLLHKGEQVTGFYIYDSTYFGSTGSKYADVKVYMDLSTGTRVCIADSDENDFTSMAPSGTVLTIKYNTFNLKRIGPKEAIYVENPPEDKSKYPEVKPAGYHLDISKGAIDESDIAIRFCAQDPCPKIKGTGTYHERDSEKGDIEYPILLLPVSHDIIGRMSYEARKNFPQVKIPAIEGMRGMPTVEREDIIEDIDHYSDIDDEVGEKRAREKLHFFESTFHRQLVPMKLYEAMQVREELNELLSYQGLKAEFARKSAIDCFYIPRILYAPGGSYPEHDVGIFSRTIELSTSKSALLCERDSKTRTTDISELTCKDLTIESYAVVLKYNTQCNLMSFSTITLEIDPYFNIERGKSGVVFELFRT